MANNFLRQLFGGTEPSYAGLRVPRQMMQDDSRLIRLGNPQERFRDYHSPDMFDRTKSPIGSDVLGLAPLSDEDREAIGSGRMEAPNSRFVETEEHKRETAQKKKDLVTGIGSDIARMFAQGQEQPQNRLQFDKLNMGQFIPLVDPRFRRAKGGKVKKGQPYLVGEEGAEIVVPEQDGEVIANDALVASAPPPPDELTTTTPVIGERILKRDAEALPMQPPQEEVSITEDVVEPSVADMWRQKIQAVQGRDYSKKKNEDGTTAYGKDFDHKRNWKDALRGAGLGVLQSLANYQANPNDPNPLSSMLGRAIGGASAGGVLGATVDNADNKMFDRMKLAQMMPQYEQAYGMERQKKADDLQAENTRADNEINKIRIESAITAKADSEKGKAVVALNKLKWFDPKNATHAALAKRAGLDVTELQGWDDRRPFTKNVAGVEYIYKDGVFTPSNLPIDEAKTLKDYTVEMPNGEKRTYRVSQKDAANFSTQMSALGAKLAQQDKQFQQRLVLDKAKFDQAKKEFETQTMLRQQAFTAMEAARATGDMQKAQQYQLDLDKYDAMLQKMRQAMLEAKTKGELDETQFGELDKFFQK